MKSRCTDRFILNVTPKSQLNSTEERENPQEAQPA